MATHKETLELLSAHTKYDKFLEVGKKYQREIKLLNTKSKTQVSWVTTITFTYPDVDFDEGGWTDAAVFRPQAFDLVFVKLIRQGEELKKSLPAWWTGSDWKGRSIKKGDQVLCWRRSRQDEVI